jgi:hypothetical protein
MKLRPILAAAVIAISFSIASAQSVVITPRKSVHRRPKPLHEHKATFTVRRPIAKAATAALSKKITAAISPEKVLDLNIREELTEYQWLEEADYKILFNQNGLLCVEEWMVGTAAYPDSVTKRVVVDIANGAVVGPSDVLKDLPALAVLVKKKQAAEIAAATAEMKSEPDARPDELFSETNFTVQDFKQFSIDSKGLTIYYDYGFPHVVEAWEPAGEFRFSWAEIKRFVRTDSLLARFVR